MNRYSRNIGALTDNENEKIKNFKVCVVGCGGIGGYIIEMLGRIGVGSITAVDGDKFEITNLNRQILSDEDSLLTYKATAAERRIKLVNSEVKLNPITERINKQNAYKIFKDHDIIVDACDNIKTRFVIQETAEILNIPFVHGAIGGWYGQVLTVFPGDRTLNKIYGDNIEMTQENNLGNPSFTPALVAAIQVSEVLKVLLNKGSTLRNRILILDLLENDYNIMEL